MALVAARYREWSARQAGPFTLALSANGLPVALGADGTFSLSRPDGIALDLTLTATGGEATTVRIR